jgi:hypothetical protein
MFVRERLVALAAAGTVWDVTRIKVSSVSGRHPQLAGRGSVDVFLLFFSLPSGVGSVFVSSPNEFKSPPYLSLPSLSCLPFFVPCTFQPGFVCFESETMNAVLPYFFLHSLPILSQLMLFGIDPCKAHARIRDQSINQSINQTIKQ